MEQNETEILIVAFEVLKSVQFTHAEIRESYQ